MILIKAFHNRKKILEGLKRLIFKRKRIEELSKKRMDICLKCEHLEINPYLCKVCGCVLEIKTRCEDCKCGLEEINQEPKW